MIDKVREELLRKKLHDLLDQMLNEKFSYGLVTFRPDLEGKQINARLELKVEHE